MAALFRRRPPSLLVSAAVLTGCVLALLVRVDPTPSREPEIANRTLLRCAEELRTEMAQILQSTGEVPGQQVWAKEVPRRCEGLLRNRFFSVVPLELTWLTAKAVPSAPRAGTLAVYRSGDGAWFALHPIGWGPEGEAKSLTKQNGEPIWLQATFNPQL